MEHALTKKKKKNENKAEISLKFIVGVREPTFARCSNKVFETFAAFF